MVRMKVAASGPMLPTTFRMKAEAAKKTPSERLPVLISACSTRSAIMDPERIWKQMIRPTSIMVVKKTNQKTTGLELSGSTPRRRRTMGMGEPRKAIRPMMIAPFFLPMVRLTMGARTAPRIAETKTPLVIIPCCWVVKSQK